MSASGAKNATLTYDPMGRLFQIAAGSNTTQFLYDGDELVSEYNASGTLLRRYVHGPASDDPFLWYEGAGLATRPNFPGTKGGTGGQTGGGGVGPATMGALLIGGGAIICAFAEPCGIAGIATLGLGGTTILATQ